MAKPIYTPSSEAECPHGGDVLEREITDGGFSSGWAMHVKPVPRYYFDAHVHFAAGTCEGLRLAEAAAIDAKRAMELGVHRALVIINLFGARRNHAMRTGDVMDNFPYFAPEALPQLLADIPEGMHWAAYLNYKSPEPALVQAAAAHGARCIKLHNAAQIEDNAPCGLWLSEDWQAAFAEIAACGLPVLWHVTQRLTDCPYTGGARNAYWAKGRANGVRYTNEDLLQVFLQCCRLHPSIPFIGAHQLHIGWDRLDDLFTQHPNLYVDATVGCVLRENDVLYPQDKKYLREMFIRRADRILFGSDVCWGEAHFDAEDYKKHQRFLCALDLPGDVLDMVCHGNAERLFCLEALG